MTVKELIKALEKMPQNAKVLTFIKELGAFKRVEKVDLEDAKGFGFTNADKVVILDEKPFIKKEQPQEETVNLCPDCSIYCKERFVDGICK